jgi:peptidoglycan hydrolase-like protein with peptidoglycan-binding domain
MSNRYLAAALILGSIAAGPLLAQETGPQDPAKMPKPELAKVQQALKQQGYNPGAVDGTWGSGSEEALKGFQANRSIPTSHGQIDSTTLHALHVVSAQK